MGEWFKGERMELKKIFIFLILLISFSSIYATEYIYTDVFISKNLTVNGSFLCDSFKCYNISELNNTGAGASWNGLNFPPGCSPGYAVQIINQTLTCTEVVNQSQLSVKMDITDQRYNDSSKIEALNISTSLNDSTLNSKIDALNTSTSLNDTNLNNKINALNTSTALNDTGLLTRINNVNTSTNIKTFGFNTTTELYNYFITLFYDIGNSKNFVNKTQTDGWYFNESEITNMNTSIHSKIDALNTSISTNDTNLNNKINALNTSTSTNDTNLLNIINALNTSTALNDSGLLTRINNVNTSTNIKTFGFNTTTELYNYFITLFYDIGNSKNFVNKTQTDGWYFNESEITSMNNTIFANLVPYSNANQTVNLNGRNLTNVSVLNVTGEIFYKDEQGETHKITRHQTHFDSLTKNMVSDDINVGINISGGIAYLTVTAINGNIEVNINETLYDTGLMTQQIALTAGTNATPTLNYVYYYVNAGTITLASATSYPSNVEHAEIAYISLGQVTTSANIYSKFPKTNELNRMLYNIEERFADTGTLYLSGFDTNVTATTLNMSTGAFRSVLTRIASVNNLTMASGYYFINSSNEYVQATSLASLTHCQDGTEFNGVNTRVNVVWGVVPINNTHVRLVAVLPSCTGTFYTSTTGVDQDAFSETRYFPPNTELRKNFLPIARTIVRTNTDVFEPFNNGLYVKFLGGTVTSGGSAPSSAISDHNLLNNLDYSVAGHTGFASTTDLALKLSANQVNNGTSNLTIAQIASNLSNITIVRNGTALCVGQTVQNVTINSSGVFTQCITPTGATYTNGTGLTLDGTKFNVTADTCTAGNYSRYDGAKFSCYPLGSGTGTVTNVATGTGLVGGPITTTGTINISTTYFDTEYTNKTYADGRYIQLVNEGLLSVSYADNAGTSGNTLSWYGTSQWGASGNGFLMLNTSFGPGGDSLEINQTRFDIDYYRKGVIDTMNSTTINKIDALNTSTALNDSGLLNRINSINSSTNIESLGFNTTAKLTSFFNSIYYNRTVMDAMNSTIHNKIDALNTSTSLNDSVMNAKINVINASLNGNGTMNWTQMEVYPAACPAGSAVTQINDTIVCTTFLQTVPYQNSSAGWSNTTTTTSTALNVNFTGNLFNGNDFMYNTTTKKLFIGTAGDYDSSATVLIYGDYDSYKPQSVNLETYDNYSGYSISTSRGTGASPTQSSVGDFIGGLRWYFRNATLYKESAYIKSSVTINTSSSNLRLGTNGVDRLVINDSIITSNLNITMPNSNSCISIGGSGQICGNSTCMWIISPDRNTTMKVANVGTTC